MRVPYSIFMQYLRYLYVPILFHGVPPIFYGVFRFCTFVLSETNIVPPYHYISQRLHSFSTMRVTYTIVMQYLRYLYVPMIFHVVTLFFMVFFGASFFLMILHVFHRIVFHVNSWRFVATHGVSWICVVFRSNP